MITVDDLIKILDTKGNRYGGAQFGVATERNANLTNF